MRVNEINCLFKQIMKMFNIGKTQVYEILKEKTEIFDAVGKLW